MNPQLHDVPDHLLDGSNGRTLEAWCTARGFRPTLLEVHHERVRRGMAKDYQPPKRRKREPQGER